MAERKSSKFRFNADEQEPDEFYQEEMKDLRIEKLSQRITVISILLPCLIAVAIYLGYRDLTARVHQGRDRENLEVQKLSKQMEELSQTLNDKLATFSKTLSAQDQDFDNTISAKLAAISKSMDGLNQSIDTINQNLKQTQSAIKKLDEAKADKKSQETAIVGLKSDLTSLKNEVQSGTDIRQSLASVSSEMENLAKQIAEQQAEISENNAQLKKEFDMLQASIADQLNEKMDKAALGVELLMYKKNQSNLSQEIERLVYRLDLIQKKMETIQPGAKFNDQPEMSGDSNVPSTQPGGAENQNLPENQSLSTSEDIKVEEQDLPPE